MVRTAQMSVKKALPCQCIRQASSVTATANAVARKRPLPSTSSSPLPQHLLHRTSPFTRAFAYAATSPKLSPENVPSLRLSTVERLEGFKEILKRHPLLKDADWIGRVNTVIENAKALNRRARIAVVGSRALVTAALDDRLSSDDDLSVTLASRGLDGANEGLLITYGPKTATNSNQLAIPSAWLRDHKVDIIEFNSFDSPRTLDALYSADVILIKGPSDELDLLSSEDPSASLGTYEHIVAEHIEHPCLIVVSEVENPQDPRASEIQAELYRDVWGAGGDHRPIALVSTKMALAGLDELSPDDPSTPISYEKFQDAYVGSGVPRLLQDVQQYLTLKAGPSTEPGIPTSLQQETAQYALENIEDLAFAECAIVKETIEDVEEGINALAAYGEEEAAAAFDGLGIVDGSLKVPSQDITESVQQLEALFLGPLAWWKLPFKTDDITTEIAVVLESSYLRRFEDRLIFDTGRTISLASRASDRTHELLTSPAFSAPALSQLSPMASFHSPILLNRIDQAAVEAAKATSSDLSSVILSRRAQITAPGGPAEVLQSRAQKSVISASSLSTGSIGAGVLSHLTEYADLATNFGVGAFGTMLAAWFLQRGWNKATKKFLVDVKERVTGGLEDDLGVAAKRLVDRSLFKLNTAVAGSRELVYRRSAQLIAVKEDIDKLQSRP